MFLPTLQATLQNILKLRSYCIRNVYEFPNHINLFKCERIEYDSEIHYIIYIRIIYNAKIRKWRLKCGRKDQVAIYHGECIVSR